MITYEKALSSILDATPHGAAETIAPAPGRVAATELAAPVNVPGFANSAMDGFAVRFREVTSADTAAIELKVVGVITAGSSPVQDSAPPGSCWEIMTGAAVPEGFDSVIPVERIERSGDTVTVSASPTEGANVRHPGEDFREGEPLLSPGELITPEVVMGLAALGIDQLQAYCRPQVSVITTGNELDDNANRQALAGSMIRDANRPFLEAAIARSGANLTLSTTVGDTPAELQKTITAAAQQSGIILTTGGVSAGSMDFVPGALSDMGADILFHKVAIRPGKPVLFARLPDGTLVFGLPGNPVAVAACFRFFVVPAIRALQGLPQERLLTATLDSAQSKRAEFRFFAKAHTETDASGRQHVTVLPGQQSFKIKPLMQANCWAILEEGRGEVDAGETVLIAPL